jgi:hypothetical protein
MTRAANRTAEPHPTAEQLRRLDALIRLDDDYKNEERFVVKFGLAVLSLWGDASYHHDKRGMSAQVAEEVLSIGSEDATIATPERLQRLIYLLHCRDDYFGIYNSYAVRLGGEILALWGDGGYAQRIPPIGHQPTLPLA